MCVPITHVTSRHFPHFLILQRLKTDSSNNNGKKKMFKIEQTSSSDNNIQQIINDIAIILKDIIPLKNER